MNFFTAMVDSRATNSFVHYKVVQYLNATSVDISAMRVAQADGYYIDCSTAVPLYLKLCENLQSHFSRVSEILHIGCCILYSILQNLTRDMLLGMDWLHAINHWTDYHAYLLSLNCGGHPLCTLGTK